jgi:hypothetical protein
MVKLLTGEDKQPEVQDAEVEHTSEEEDDEEDEE